MCIIIASVACLPAILLSVSSETTWEKGTPGVVLRSIGFSLRLPKFRPSALPSLHPETGPSRLGAQDARGFLSSKTHRPAKETDNRSLPHLSAGMHPCQESKQAVLEGRCPLKPVWWGEHCDLRWPPSVEENEVSWLFPSAYSGWQWVEEELGLHSRIPPYKDPPFVLLRSDSC